MLRFNGKNANLGELESMSEATSESKNQRLVHQALANN